MHPLEDGHYWCSHELDLYLSPGRTYDEEWTLYEVCGGKVIVGVDFMMQGFDEIAVADLPSYVRMVGPLKPPSS